MKLIKLLSLIKYLTFLTTILYMIKKHTGLKDCEFCKGRRVSCYEVLMERMRLNPLTEEMQSNLEGLLIAANLLRDKYGKILIISSGYRPESQNNTTGGAKKSAHLSCQAIDFADKSRELRDFIKEDLKILEECGLYLEEPSKTPTWIHIQTRKTVSGKRVFLP